MPDELYCYLDIAKGNMFCNAMFLFGQAEEIFGKLMGLAESLKTPALQDEVIKEAVLEQGEKVLRGEADPKEAAAAVAQKVNLYLAE